MEEIRVDQNGIANYKDNFNNERNNFINQTYSTFNSSYIARCYDSKVSIIQKRLREKYEKINHLYNAINNYLTEYTNCIRTTENALKNETNYTANSMVNSVLCRLAELENFTPNLKHMTFVETSTFEYAKESITYTASSNVEVFNKAMNNVKSNIVESASANWANLKQFGSTALDALLNVGAVYTESQNAEILFAYEAFNGLKENGKELGKNIQEKMAATASNISSFAKDTWNNYAYYEQLNAQYAQETANAEWEALKKVGGTIATTATSLVEGIARFGESIVDTVGILGTGVLSLGTGAYDGYHAIKSLITGEEWHSKTKEMWNETMSFVSEKHVETWFDDMYENTEYGQFLKNNSYGFNTNRDISSGIGEVVGIVALSILTFGVGGAALGGSAAAGTVTSAQMAAVAGASGFGKGAEKSWGEGAGVAEGLGYASLNAGWEALQYYLGGKIGNSNFFLPKEAEIPPTIKNKLLNSLSKIVLDTIDSGVEGFVQPMLNLTYKDGYTDANGTYHEFTEQDNIFTKYFNLFDENGGWNYVRTNAIIGGASSALGEGFDISKYFKDKVDIDVDDLDIETKTSIIEQATADLINDPTDASAIAKANYYTGKGDNALFRFSSADKLPDINDDFWNGFKNPEQIMISINGRLMSFDDAISYKLNYDSNLKSSTNMKDDIAQLDQFWEQMNSKNTNANINKTEHLTNDLNLQKPKEVSNLTEIQNKKNNFASKNIEGRNHLMTEFKSGQDILGGNQSSGLEKFKKLLKSSEDKYEVKLMEDTIRQKYPNATKQEMAEILKNVASSGCTYVATANNIFEQLNYNPKRFKEIFGFDMYLPNGKLNQNQLILDIFTTLDTWEKVDYRGNYELVNFSSWSEAANKIFGEDLATGEAMSRVVMEGSSNGWSIDGCGGNPDGSVTLKKMNLQTQSIIGTPQEIVHELLGKDIEVSKDNLAQILKENNIYATVHHSQPGEKIFSSRNNYEWMKKYLKQKDPSLDYKCNEVYASDYEIPDFLNKVKEAYNEGYSVTVYTLEKDNPVWMTDGTKLGGYTFSGQQDTSHAMIIRGITEKGDLIVSSWGKYFSIPIEFVENLVFNFVNIGGIK